MKKIVRLGIFGGTFNPIHYGHLRAAEEAREFLSLDKLLLIPSGNPPLKTRDIAPAADRYAMACMAVEGNPWAEVLDIECSAPGKSYTVQTLHALCGHYKKAELFFVLGVDAFMDIPNWWRPDELVSLVHFIILSRPDTRFADLSSSPYLRISKDLLRQLDNGTRPALTARLISGRRCHLLNMTPVVISSSAIRARIRKGLSIKYLLPESVESYIIFKKLYKKSGRHIVRKGGKSANQQGTSPRSSQGSP